MARCPSRRFWIPVHSTITLSLRLTLVLTGRDVAGDVVQPIDPAPGFWEKHRS
jgi:hypothetical protein